MVHILVVIGTLWLVMRLLQWDKSFHLDELPEFNRFVFEGEKFGRNSLGFSGPVRPSVL